MRIPVVPALIPESREEVIAFTNTVQFAHEIQIDVVDGQFVPAISWPYNSNEEPFAVKSLTDPYTLEVDLMVSNPIEAATAWLKAGADMLVFHVETLSVEALSNFAENNTVSIGVACHGDTSLETLFSYAEFADYVQLMGIHEIGLQGQPFNEKVLDDIGAVKRRFEGMMVSIDGSVNESTIAKLRKAGADRFVSGSAIVKSSNPLESYKKLKSLVE